MTALLVLAFACFRISRVLIEDTIADPFRDWIFRRWPGTDVEYSEADRHRVRGGTFELGGTLYASNPTETGDKLTKLLGCYACTGFWVSFFVTLSYMIWPTPTFWLMVPFALSGVVWLLALVQEKID